MKTPYEFYLSGLVRRWHNRPQIPEQTTGAHSFGMLQLLLYLHPNPSANLMKAIILHDLPEKKTGDFPHSAKRQWPVLSDIDREASVEFLADFDLEFPELTAQEKLWVKYLDQLEPLFYLQFKGMHLIGDPEVNEMFVEIQKLCRELFLQLQAFGYFKDPETEALH